jgi:hypothetical protein
MANSPGDRTVLGAFEVAKETDMSALALIILAAIVFFEVFDPWLDSLGEDDEK